MDVKTKRIIFFLGAVFVAIIFVTSYAAFNNNNSANATGTSTAKTPVTVFVTGSSNAVITNYSNIAYVRSLGSSNATANSLKGIILQLQANGTIQNYAYTNGSFQLVLSNISAYGLQGLLYQRLNSSNSITVGSTAQIMLPMYLNLYYSNSPVNVFLANRNYSVYISSLKKVGTTINVTISALVTTNGKIYNNNIRVSYAKG